MLTRLAALAAVSLVPLAVAAPAQAAGSCSISVPSKVSVSSPTRDLTATFSAGCSKYAVDAWWGVMTPAGEYADMFHFDGARTDTIEWYDVNRTGTFRVQADEAYDEAHELVPQNSTSMSVRFASRTAVTSARSGSTVSVTATTSRYAWSASAFRPWAGAKATLESRKCSTCAWTPVKTGTTSTKGVVTLTAYASTARSWRVVTADTPSTWGKVSSTTTR